MIKPKGLDPSPYFLLVIVVALVAVVGTILGKAFS
jgi:hypothetical protein